ncbi:MAG: MFS transporter [Proteobacteria bacterium]|nr:MFS transporter [Pseudomonadota bacterium]
MNPREQRAILGLAGIYGLRMFGLFLILPIFAIYASHLQGHVSRTLVGLALGAYGLTQAILQLPFGMLSDRFGRKRMMYFGLALFALGSFIAGATQNIGWIIFGRAIQGSGAISAAIMALLADLTREEHRTKAFAVVGMSIGVTFALSLVLGPALYRLIGVPGIFILTGVCALLAIAVVARYVPDPEVSHFHTDTEVSVAKLKGVLSNRELIRLDFGIFSLHAAQMALFVVIPFAIERTSGLPVNEHWKIYLPVMIVAFILMVPFIIYGEKKNRLKQVFCGAIFTLLVAQIVLGAFTGSFKGILVYLVLFYIAFNVLEATLPSLISKIAPIAAKGTAIGVYNTGQSLGIFVGSVVGGFLAQHEGTEAVFVFSGILIAIWLLLALTMRVPAPTRTLVFGMNRQVELSQSGQIQAALQQLAGVVEAVVLAEEQVAYIKVLRSGYDEAGVDSLIHPQST